MTQNQIAWYKAHEDARANRERQIEETRSNIARETETARHNRRSESLSARSITSEERKTLLNLAEHRRHNLEAERQWKDDLAERTRSNSMQRVIAYRDFAERSRSHRATEQLASKRLSHEMFQSNRVLALDRLKHFETVRSNTAREAEVHRHNRNTEAAEKGKQLIQYGDFITRKRQAEELKRSNVAREQIAREQNLNNAVKQTFGEIVKAGASLLAAAIPYANFN